MVLEMIKHAEHISEVQGDKSNNRLRLTGRECRTISTNAS
jgi:hypothetical protein